MDKSNKGKSAMSKILSLIKSKIWAIQQEHLEYMAGSIGETINTMTAENMKPKIYGSTAVLPVNGVITQKADIMSALFGGVSSEILGMYFTELANHKDIKNIVLDIDSPGGEVFGTGELVAKMSANKNGKKVYAVANSLMASAAYWIGSVADEMYSTPSGLSGSIGVIAIHEDISEAAKSAGVKFNIITAGDHKGDGNPYEPLTDGARAEIQKRVDYYYGMFIKSVSENRRISQKSLKESYGNGKIYTADEALKLGVIDGIATLEQVVNKLQRAESKKQKNRNLSATL